MIPGETYWEHFHPVPVLRHPGRGSRMERTSHVPIARECFDLAITIGESHPEARCQAFCAPFRIAAQNLGIYFADLDQSATVMWIGKRSAQRHDAYLPWTARRPASE